jgi:cell division transport system permease protein
MKLRNVGYFFAEALSNFFKNSLMSLTSIFMTTVSIMVFGIFLLVSINLNFLACELEEQYKIHVYFASGTNAYYVEKARLELEKIDGVRRADLFTKEQAFDDMFENTFKDRYRYLIEGLRDDNPFRDSYKLTLNDIGTADRVAEQAKSIEGVEDVTNKVSVVQNIVKFTNVLKYASLFLVTILGVISIFIISNTIKLVVFSRRREINIMKFIGATNWFVRWPYIIEGLLVGLISGALSFVIVLLGYNEIAQHFGIFAGMMRFRSIYEMYNLVGSKLLILGISIGAIGSYISIRRYLRV